MCVAATGFFDGVHKGHYKVIERVCSLAKEQGLESQIITFWPHPRSVLQQDAHDLRLLTSLEEKRELLNKMGIDRITVLEFTKEFSELSTEEFVKEYLIKRCGVKVLVIGYDHRIGNEKNQSQAEMIKKCSDAGLEVVRIEEVTVDNDESAIVSSTKIRNLIKQGDIFAANNYLGYQYSIRGVVVSGNRLGRTIGFPTANLSLYDPLKLVPECGVYLVRAKLNPKMINSAKSNDYKAICNIGYRPTVGDNNSLTIETHLLDFNEEIYGLDLSIDFISRIRDEQKFSSLDELKYQLEIDKNFARNSDLF